MALLVEPPAGTECGIMPNTTIARYKPHVEEVALGITVRVCHAGQLVAIPGRPSSHLYFLTRGYTDVYVHDLLIAAPHSFNPHRFSSIAQCHCVTNGI